MCRITAKRIFRIICYPLFAAGLLFSVSTDTFPLSQNRPNILVLHSYHENMIWTEEINSGILQTFRDLGQDPQLHFEYMDWKYSPNEENLLLRYKQYKLRYSDRHIDLIITVDDAALIFALKHRREIFSNAPVVFSGVIKKTALRITAGQKNVTGICERFDTEGTVQLMKKLDPSLSRLYLIYDNTESGLQSGELMATSALATAPELELVHLNRWKISNIITTLGDRQLSSHSAVLINTYSLDIEGTAMEMQRFVKMISASSNAPVYILYNFDSGYGAVGGKLINGHTFGAAAARLSTRILKGEKASDIMFIDDVDSTPVLDHVQLGRYGFLNRIPSDATLINKPVSFIGKYKIPLLTACILFLFMLAFIIVLILNIRQRNQMNKKLTASEEYLKKIINSVGDPIFVKDRLHRIILLNDALMDFIGFSRDQILGKSDRDLFSQEEAELFFTIDNAVFESGMENINTELLTDARGQTHIIETKKTLYINEKNDKFIVGVIRDITAIKNAEKYLLTAKEKLEAEVALRAKELEEANLELTKTNITMRETNQTLKAEVEERKKIEAELTSTLSSLRETQNELIQSGKMAALGSLVAGVAHEINTPLGNSVMATSYLEQLAADFDAQPENEPSRKETAARHDAELREGFKILQTNLHRVADLVRSFKTISTNQMIGDRQQFNLRSALEDIVLAVRPQLKGTKLMIEIQCSDDLEWNSYPGILSQIITNLVINSLNHAFEPGDEGVLTISARRDKNDIIIEYADNGKGMDESIREKIFEPFFTTRRGRGGTGLGLYIVYNLVTRELAGDISCRSIPGKGSTFIIRASG